MMNSLLFKKMSLGIFISTLLLGGFYYLNMNTATTYQRLPKLERTAVSMEQEFERTKDPALGIIPRERLIAAKQYADRLRSQPTSSRSAIANVGWDERGPNNVSGRTRALLIDASDPTGGTVWTGGVGGGIWYTTNALASSPTWTAVDDFFDNIAVTTIAQSPLNNNRMYFGTGEGWFNIDAIRGLGIWASKNGGSDWEQLASTNNATFRFVQKIVVAGNNDIFAATRNGGLQRSQDAGTTWQEVLGTATGAGVNAAADIEIAANGDLYCSMGIFSADGIYRSTDGGNTWTMLAVPVAGFQRIELATAPSNAGRIYALFQNSMTLGCGAILRSNNSGATWTAVPVPAASGMTEFTRGQAWYDLIAAVDPNNADRLFIGGIDLLLSNNGGTSFNQISQWFGNGFQYVHADQHAIAFVPGSSSTIFFGNDGGVYRTTNGTNSTPSIDFISDGYNVTQFYAADIHPDAGEDHFIGGTQDNGTQRFLAPDLGNTFEVTGGDGGFCHIDQDNPDIQISSFTRNNYNITNDAWANSTSVQIGTGAGLFINPTDYDSDANILYASGTANGRYGRITDVGNGNNTNTQVVGAFSGGSVTAVRVSPNVANRVYFGLSNGDIIRVDNANGGGITATNVRGGFGTVSCITVEEGDEDHMLVTYSNYGVNSAFETTNAGLSWASIEGNLPDMPIRWIEFNPNDADQALVATELGVWSTDDLAGPATDWEPTNDGLANTRVDMLAWRASDGEMIAATHGRGLFSTNFSCSRPTGLFTSNLTSTFITLNWSTSSGATQFEVQYRLASASAWTNAGTVTGTSIFISSLIPGQDYEWRVRAICGGINSSFAYSTFKTLNGIPPCPGTVSYYPYTNGFESNLGWTNGVDDDIDWTRWSGSTPSQQTGPTTAAEGTYYAYVEVSWPNYPTKTAHLYSPCFNLQNLCKPEIFFQYHMKGTNVGTLMLEVSTSNGAIWTPIWSRSQQQGQDWLPATVSLNSYTNSSSLRLRFKGTSANGWRGDLCIDDIQVRTSCQSCGTPTGPTVIYTVPGGAFLAWGQVSSATSYEIEYRPVGSGSWTSVSGITSVPYTLQGLSSGTTYEWRVRAICPGGNSAFVNGYNFTVFSQFCSPPTGLASNIVGNSVTVSWTAVPDAQSYDLRYRLYGSSTWTTIGNYTATSKNLALQAGGTKYEWQVRTNCKGNKESDYSTILQFSTSSLVKDAVSSGNLSDPIDELDIKAYPNPFTDFIWIDLSALSGMAEVSVFDAVGKKVWQSQLEAGKRSQIYPQVPAGMYIVRIQQADMQKEIKLIKVE